MQRQEEEVAAREQAARAALEAASHRKALVGDLAHLAEAPAAKDDAGDAADEEGKGNDKA